MIALLLSVALANTYDYSVITRNNKTYVIVENENEKYVTSVDGTDNIDINAIIKDICKQQKKCKDYEKK